ncbi:MAG: zf-HC2 domain-containing protein [Candidatus Limnocylindrales bacterium]
MTRFARIRRRPDHWASPHDRARVRAAERLDGPLGLAEATWLDEHLAGCEACTAIAAAYEADRLSLRALAANPPEPPRDLWARTAAAIERESAANGRGATPDARPVGRRIPLGALSGIAVIAVVVGVSAVSTNLFSGQSGAAVGTLSGVGGAAASDSARTDLGTQGAEVAGAIPTPIAVGAGEVQWVRARGDGTYAYNAAPIDEVCPADGQDGCATLADAAAKRFALTSEPETIIGSPTDGQAVVVSRDSAGRQSIVVVDLPTTETAAIDPEPVTVPSEAPTLGPSAAPASPAIPEATPSGSAQSGPSDPPASTPPASVKPSPTPTVSPEPTVAASLALADGVEVVGPSAAFSADGEWFAFTARPADGNGGPDVYLWKVGDRTARPLTTDGRSTFASWAGDQVLVSRAGGDTSGETPSASTSAVDPVSGVELPAGTSWRPVVDPSGTWAVAWVGDVQATSVADADAYRLADGRLELQAWPPIVDASTSAGQVVVDAAVADFDVRWDGSGTWFAVWVSDPTDPSLGRLSLFQVDPSTGVLGQPDGAPRGVPALPGFSIEQGRLAWATPPGQGGEGSRVQIVAWSDGGVGTVETAPGEDLVVVR